MAHDRNKPGAKAEPEATSADRARAKLEEAFKKGSEFAEELLRENERLRYRVAELEARHGGDDEALIKQLVDKVSRLEHERDVLVRRFGDVEAQNRSYQERYAQIEAEHNNLLNIYVANFQLHATLEEDDVRRTVAEIILNFIGARQFAVAVLDPGGERLVPVVAEEIERARVLELSVQEGRVGEALRTGEAYFSDALDAGPAGEPVACVPLTVEGRTIGAILVFSYLPQKEALQAVDHELFNLLAAQAATAILAAKAYGDLGGTPSLPQLVESMIRTNLHG